MTRRHLGKKIVMEEKTPSVAVIPKEDRAPAADSLETDLVEVTDTVAESEVTDAAVEEAEEVSEALESIYDVMTQSIAHGGLDKSSAQVANVAIEHLYKRVGIKAKAMPALESFEWPAARITATELAMEGIGDAMKKIWDAIVKAIKDSIQWIKNFFSKIFGATDKVEERADELDKELKQLENSKATIKAIAMESNSMNTMKNETIATGLSIGGKTGPVQHATEAFLSVADSIFSEHTSRIKSSSEDFVKYLETNYLDEMKEPDIEEAPTVNCDYLAVKGMEYVPNAYSKGFGRVGDNGALYRSRELPGNDAAISYTTDKDAKGVAIFINVKQCMDNFDPKRSPITNFKVPILTLPECKQVIQCVKEYSGKSSSYKASLEKTEQLRERLIKMSEKIGKDSERKAMMEVGKESGKRKLRDLQQAIVSIAKLVDSSAATFSVYGVKTSKLFLDYVALSMKQYS